MASVLAVLSRDDSTGAGRIVFLQFHDLQFCAFRKVRAEGVGNALSERAVCPFVDIGS